MSDPVEVPKKKPRFANWPLFGADGIPSIRQILGLASFVSAYQFGQWGLAKGGDVTVFAPMLIAVLAGAFLFGFITWQNIQGMVRPGRGDERKEPPCGK